MKKLVGAVLWQWTLIAFALFMILMWGEGGFTGNVILQSDDAGIFAPPYDVYTGSNIISLSHNQIDNNSYHVEVDINQQDAMIYSHLYYYTNSGWQQIQLSTSNDWIVRRSSIGIEGAYTDQTLQEGDDFYVAVWTCKGVGEEWKCGCKDPSDCGYWHVQGIDLESEGDTTPCTDNDGDGYGDPASSECFLPLRDCNDASAAINPGSIEIPYNGIDDDCNSSTVDDDLDQDGFIFTNDCDDENANRHPSASEICEDGIDQNCDLEDKICTQCGEGSIPSLGCSCSGNPYYTGYCCDNSWQDTPCGTPEVVFYDGFESGTANTWDYLNPYSEVNSDVVRQGQYSLNLRYTPGGKTSLNYDQYASTDISAQQHLYFRWYQRFEADFIHPVNGLELNRISNDASDWQVSLKTTRWQGDVAKARLWIDMGKGLQDVGATMSTDRWYCLEMEVLSNNDGVDNGLIRVWVDDAQIYSKSSLSFSDGSLMNHYEQGGFYDGSFGSVPIHSYVDDVVVSKARIGC